MAKELDKLRKEFAPMLAQTQTATKTLDVTAKNFTHLRLQLNEASAEVTRCVAALRKKGHGGTKLADFEKEKEFQPILAQAKKLDQAKAEAVKVIDANKASAAALVPKMEKLRKHLAEEIASRKTKKKILGVDSASLPDLEKLLKEVTEAYGELQDVARESVPRTWQADGLRRDLEQAVADSPDDVKASDLSGEDERFIDSRVAHRNANQASTHRKTQTQHLSDAVKFRKASDPTSMHDALEKATAEREAIQTMAERYDRILKDMTPMRLKSMGEASEGKKVLASVAIIRKLDTEAGKELSAVLKQLGG